MTVTALPSRSEYTAVGGETIFFHTFMIFAATDLNVYVTPSGQVADDNADIITTYTVNASTLGNPPGGYITLDNALSAGDRITLASNIPDDRTVDYQNSGDFRPDTVNADFDRTIALVKQQAGRAGRTLAFEESQQNASDLNLALPEAGLYLRWRSDELGTENAGVPASIVLTKEYATVAALQAIPAGSGDDDTTLAIGDFVVLEDYWGGNSSGIMFGKIVAGGTGTDDGGSYIDLTSSGYQFQQNFKNNLTLAVQFGVRFDDVSGNATANTTRLQAAWDYDKTLVLSPGTVYVNAPITRDVTGMQIIGPGAGTCIIKAHSGFVGSKIIDMGNTSTSRARCRVTGVMFDNDAEDPSLVAVRWRRVNTGSSIDRCIFTHVTTGIQFQYLSLSNSVMFNRFNDGTNAIQLIDTGGNSTRFCNNYLNGVRVYLDGSMTDVVITHNTFDPNATIYSDDTVGHRGCRITHNRFENGRFNSTSDPSFEYIPVQLAVTRGIDIHSNFFQGNGQAGELIINPTSEDTAVAVTSTTLTMAATENFCEDELVGYAIGIKSATTGANQLRTITANDKTTNVVTVDPAWDTTPTGTVVYVLQDTPDLVADDTAQSVTSTTLTMAATETFNNDALVDFTVCIKSATTGADQVRTITGNVLATQVITLDSPWDTTPTGTIVYHINDATEAITPVRTTHAIDFTSTSVSQVANLVHSNYYEGFSTNFLKSDMPNNALVAHNNNTNIGEELAEPYDVNDSRFDLLGELLFDTLVPRSGVLDLDFDSVLLGSSNKVNTQTIVKAGVVAGATDIFSIVVPSSQQGDYMVELTMYMSFNQTASATACRVGKYLWSQTIDSTLVATNSAITIQDLTAEAARLPGSRSITSAAVTLNKISETETRLNLNMVLVGTGGVKVICEAKVISESFSVLPALTAL